MIAGEIIQMDGLNYFFITKKDGIYYFIDHEGARISLTADELMVAEL